MSSTKWPQTARCFLGFFFFLILYSLSYKSFLPSTLFCPSLKGDGPLYKVTKFVSPGLSPLIIFEHFKVPPIPDTAGEKRGSYFGSVSLVRIRHLSLTGTICLYLLGTQVHFPKWQLIFALRKCLLALGTKESPESPRRLCSLTA